MSDRDLFGRTDFVNGTVNVNGNTYELLDKSFPTVDPKSPLTLSEGEKELMKVLKASFRHSEKLQRHIRFIYAKGAMYKTCNNNLLFHGCIPMDSNGELQSVKIQEVKYSGKALLDKLGELILFPCDTDS